MLRLPGRIVSWEAECLRVKEEVQDRTMGRFCVDVSPMCPVLLLVMLLGIGARADTNVVYSPCMDTTVLKNDGFTFGLAIGSNYSFFVDRTQYSPCDSRLQGGLSSGHLALFRPKVDEISLLLVNYTELDPVSIMIILLYILKLRTFNFAKFVECCS